MQAGDQIDIWVVDHALGSGGMGSVYRCHNRNAPRILAAIKVLESHLRAHKEIEARFIREAEILFQLDHPNIVKVRNIRTDHDPPYLEMEFVEGESLEDVLQRGPVAYPRGLEMMAQAAAAVHYLHRKGVRHRDIKPANLLVRKDGRLKLVDFGLALETDTSRITQHGMAFGTVSYAPPEWASPELDPTAWDMYALGVVFWEILTGEVAFPMSGQGNARQQAMQVIIRKQGHAPLDPGEAFPAGLRELIAHMTMADLNERLVDSAEVRRRLHELEGLGPPPPTDTFDPDEEPSVIIAAPTPGVPPMRRHTQGSADTWQADAPDARPPATPSSQRGLIAASLVSLGAVGLGVVTLLLAVIAWFVLGGTAPRPVELVVTGIGRDVPVDLSLAGLAPSGGTPLARTFAKVPTGTQAVRWAVGKECTVTACWDDDGPCPAWCGTGSSEVRIDAGSDAQVVSVTVDPPTARTVRLPLRGVDADTSVEASLGGAVGKRTADGLAFSGLSPGRYTLALTAGTCPDDARDCASDGDCPSGCADHRASVVIPWSPAPLDALDVTLGTAPKGKRPRSGPRPAPAPAPADPAPDAPPAPVPAPVPAPSPTSGPGRTVTVNQFAAWLAKHPEYQPGGPRAAGAGYLPGWSGSTPPGGAVGSSPMTGVSWYAANAYCRGRGGLPGVDIPADSGAMFEWRANGTSPAAYDATAGPIPTNGTDETMLSFATFRCAS